MDVMGQGNFEQLLSFPEKFLREAAECGHRSFCIMAGALEGSSVESRALSHEGPWGVGYGVCTYKVQQPDPYVQLARMTVESFVRERTVPSVPEDLPEEMLHNRQVPLSVSTSTGSSGAVLGQLVLPRAASPGKSYRMP